MTRKTKRMKQFEELLSGSSESCPLDEAIEILKKAPGVKFDQSVEVSLKMGLDPRKADQQVRGTVSLPHGTGKSIKVLVFAKGDKQKEAEEAGADFVGFEELVEKVKGGWTDFDVVVATPDMMREVGKLGKILGPRNLMPNPKAGTVTTDVATAVKELKAGKVEFKLNKNSQVNGAIAKLSFDSAQIRENVMAYMRALQRAKPPGAKGQYIISLALASTMGPGVKVQVNELGL